jgi:molybdopterin molybdotransferase
MKESLTRLEDALKVVLDTVPVLGVEKIGLLDALGRVLAEDIIAERDNPPWDNSAMDGFAVRYEDIQQAHVITTPTVLKVIEDVPAGKFPAKPVGKGEAIRIMTGAPIPKGADTVLKVEDTENTPTTVKVFKEEKKGANIRLQGEDVRKGQRPRVAILSTGDELADLDERFNEEKIVNSNSYAIAAQVKEAGGLPILLGIAKDNPDHLKRKIREGLNADFLVLSGGVSMGVYDFTKPVFQELGGEMNFWKLAIRPGQPVAFGKIGRTLAFGLPGNPVSSMVTFEQLVRPAILKMCGSQMLNRPVVQALFQEKFSKRPDRRHFLRGILWMENGMLMVRTTGSQGSGILTSMVKANGLIDVPVEVEKLKPGDVVNVQVLGGGF